MGVDRGGFLPSKLESTVCVGYLTTYLTTKVKDNSLDREYVIHKITRRVFHLNLYLLSVVNRWYRCHREVDQLNLKSQ